MPQTTEPPIAQPHSILEAARLEEPWELLRSCLGMHKIQADLPPDWQWKEELDSISTIRELTLRAEKLHKCAGRMADLLAGYQGAVSGEIENLKDPNHPLHLAPGLARKEIQRFLDATAERSDYLEVRIEIDKRRLLEQTVGKERLQVLGVRPFLIFYEETLIRELEEQTQSLEDWWTAPHAPAHPRVAFFVPCWRRGEDSQELIGPHLAVIGGDPLGGLKRMEAELGSETTGSPTSLYKTARPPVNWQEPLRLLTPAHLEIRGGADTQDRAADLLGLHLVNLCLMYTANWTQILQGRPNAIFAGTRGHMEVPLASSTEIAPLHPVGIRALLQITEGCYDGKWNLGLAQSVIADSLQEIEPASKRLIGLVRRAPALLLEIQSKWALFLAKELGEFAVQLQALEDDVAETVRSFAEQTSDMIKSLSETVLATVAVVLGCFVAALVKEEFNPAVLLIGAVLYLAYLILFPLIYSMRARQQAYDALEAQFTERRKRFSARLSQAKVDEIVGTQFEDSRRRFEEWLRLTRWLYWGVIAVFLLSIGLFWAFV